MDTSLQPIDLTKAFPPTSPIIDCAVSQTFARLAVDCDLGSRIRLNRSAGHWADRVAGATWLSCRFNTPPSADRIIITNGTQSALALILQSLAVPGDLIVSESLTYAVLKQIVTRLGMRLRGIPVDKWGLVPEAFETVCQTHSPKALYCNPTVHNPTTAVMPEPRRSAIANIARRYGVFIIEDDVIGALHGPDPRPIAAIAPDVTWYCMSLSKCFAMGLRLAYVLAPSQQAGADLLQPVQNLSSWMPSSLSLMLVADWIETKLGHQITRAMQKEIADRHRMAASLLPTVEYSTAPGALHIWLRIPPAFTPPTFTQAAARAGVGIRPSNLFSVDDSPAPNAVRISLTTPTDRTDLETGLKRIAALMEVSHGAC